MTGRVLGDEVELNLPGGAGDGAEVGELT